MPNYFTHYWDRDTFEFQQELDEQLLYHTAGNQFRARGVEEGDTVYVVNVARGELRLLGKVKVDRIVGYEQAKQILPFEPYKAADHCIGSKAASAPIGYNRYVPKDIVRKLSFVRKSGELVAPRFKDARAGLLDQQTLRGVRQLSDDSARRLDALL
jgi:hypothetical protein